MNAIKIKKHRLKLYYGIFSLSMTVMILYHTHIFKLTHIVGSSSSTDVVFASFLFFIRVLCVFAFYLLIFIVPDIARISITRAHRYPHIEQRQH